MTALQDFIGDMKSVRAYIQNFHGEYYEGQRVVYDTMIEVATELLEKEKKQIVDAWENGDMDSGASDGGKYYKQTFKEKSTQADAKSNQAQ